mmetsp:Transcript_27566/g.60678  ORF Transcript_27566/g.60678 Transcript_27566/m.60678 type:complete len:127 (-) Transcript_27566:1925-2305(-)
MDEKCQSERVGWAIPNSSQFVLPRDDNNIIKYSTVWFVRCKRIGQCGRYLIPRQAGRQATLGKQSEAQRPKTTSRMKQTSKQVSKQTNKNKLQTIDGITDFKSWMILSHQSNHKKGNIYETVVASK